MTNAAGSEAREARYRDIISKLTLMSDTLMRNVFKDKECTEHLLRIILGDPGIEVLEQTLQKDYKNLWGRSAVLDCVARDQSGRIFDVEIQQEGEGATPRRARYYSGLMDMNLLKTGEDFERLPETYVIFITGDDVLGHGEPIYHIEKEIKEVRQSFGDGARIIYADASRRDETELGRLMHDLNCRESKEMHSPILAEGIRKYKETEEGVEHMCKELRELYDEGIAEGRAEGIAQGKAEGELTKARETAIYLAQKGMSIAEIAEAVKFSTQKVQEWLPGSMSMAK